MSYISMTQWAIELAVREFGMERSRIKQLLDEAAAELDRRDQLNMKVTAQSAIDAYTIGCKNIVESKIMCLIAGAVLMAVGYNRPE